MLQLNLSLNCSSPFLFQNRIMMIPETTLTYKTQTINITPASQNIQCKKNTLAKTTEVMPKKLSENCMKLCSQINSLNMQCHDFIEALLQNVYTNVIRYVNNTEASQPWMPITMMDKRGKCIHTALNVGNDLYWSKIGTTNLFPLLTITQLRQIYTRTRYILYGELVNACDHCQKDVYKMNVYRGVCCNTLLQFCDRTCFTENHDQHGCRHTDKKVMYRV